VGARIAHSSPRGLVDVEEVAAEEDAVHLLLLGNLEDLAEGYERVIFAHLILLVHPL
jgi:hypothetical protein